MAKVNQSTISRYWAATYTANQFLCVVITDKQIIVTVFDTKVTKVPQTHCKWFRMTVVTVQSLQHLLMVCLFPLRYREHENRLQKQLPLHAPSKNSGCSWPTYWELSHLPPNHCRIWNIGKDTVCTIVKQNLWKSKVCKNLFIMYQWWSRQEQILSVAEGD